MAPYGGSPGTGNQMDQEHGGFQGISLLHSFVNFKICILITSFWANLSFLCFYQVLIKCLAYDLSTQRTMKAAKSLD